MQSQISERAKRKKQEQLRAQGLGGYVDAAPVQARIRHLYDDRGITYDVIAARSGIDAETVKMQYRGFRWPDKAPVTTCFKRTEIRILGARFGPADGYRFPVVGIRRRLQALQAAGFTLTVVGELTGKDIKQVHATMSGKSNHGFVVNANAILFVGAYEKLQCADPADFGVTRVATMQTKTRARTNGYAPSHCWDSGTIDDPDAIPEWTGECGKPMGPSIHKREGIPECRPCRAVRLAGGEKVLKFSGVKLRELRLSRGWSQGGMEKSLGLGNGQLHHWEAGRHNPRKDVLARLLSEFDVTFEEMAEEES